MHALLAEDGARDRRGLTGRARQVLHSQAPTQRGPPGAGDVSTGVNALVLGATRGVGIYLSPAEQLAGRLGTNSDHGDVAGDLATVAELESQ